MSDDDEAAEDYLRLHGLNRPKGAGRMRLADWSPEVAELRVIAERIAVVAAAVIAAAGGKHPPKFPALPRPVVALDRARERAQLARHRRIAAAVLPPAE